MSLDVGCWVHGLWRSFNALEMHTPLFWREGKYTMLWPAAVMEHRAFPTLKEQAT